MVRFKEAEARLFKNIFVCQRCKTKIRASPKAVEAGKVKCRKCGSKALRRKRRERKV
jgi:ribosomal protein L40E